MDEDRPKAAPGITIGGDLSDVSLGEIDERIAELRAEIERLEAERQRKTSSLDAANAFFR